MAGSEHGPVPPDVFDRLAECDPADRAALVAAIPWLAVDPGRDALAQEIARRARVDLAGAERLAVLARDLQAGAGTAARARLSRSIGHVHALRSRLPEAMAAYEDALVGFDECGFELESAITRSGALQTLIYLGRYDDAAAWADRARNVFVAAGDRRRLARLETNVGNVLYRQDRFDEARECYRRALDAFLQDGDPADVAVALRNRAVVEISLHQFDEAAATYREARQWCERHGLAALVAEVDYNIAYLFYQRGEYARAIELYRVARERCLAADDRYHACLCDLDQSELYLEINLVPEGVQLAKRAGAGFHVLGLEYERAKALVNLATGEYLRGRVDAADLRFREARRIFVGERNAMWPPLIDLYRALVLEGRDPARAERLCRGALAFFMKTALVSKVVLAEVLLARILLDTGRSAPATALAAQALDRAERAELRPLAYQAASLLGRCHEAAGDRALAIGWYERAHALLDQLRSGLRHDELRMAFLRDKQGVYERLVSLLAGVPGQERLAFFWMEQARSRSLAEQIATQASTLPVPDALAGEVGGRLRAVRERLHGLQRDADRLDLEGAEPRRLAQVRGQVQQCEGELVSLFQELGASAPEFVAVQAAAVVDLDDVRRALPASGVLVEYFEARGRLFAAVLGHARLEVVQLGPAEHAKQTLDLLRFQLSKFRLGADYTERYATVLGQATEAHLRSLYDVLWRPLEAAIGRARHVVVIPHRRLHYVPFHALHDGHGYVVDRHAVSYAPSASVLHFCRAKVREPKPHALVLGVTDPALPAIEGEVATVASAFPDSRLFVGAGATYSTLTEEGRSARVVHLATHGTFRADSPLFSSVRLADRHLSLFDLYHLRLAAELVTLSGCATGLNALEGGDELVGLTRGLLYAGARSVLVTLWDVHDAFTAHAMAAYYRRLGTGEGKAEALAGVMRDRDAAHRHPYFWAPFVLVGDFGPLG